MRLTWGREAVDLSNRPLILGIVNVTPDSFSDGGRFFEPNRAVDQALRLVEEGADGVDIGGESTRPGATPVPEDDERRRVIPVIQALADRVAVPISIDTRKPAVAREALNAGASVINDVTGFRDPAMVDLAAETDATCVVMHMRGTPETMNDLAHYRDVVGEMMDYFAQRLETLRAAGIEATRVALDPGIGFAKKRRHNLAILKRLGEFASLGRPILLGTSRKRLLGEVTGRGELDRLAGTLATTVTGYLKGARIFRVHDVAPARDALAMAAAIESADPAPDDGINEGQTAVIGEIHR